MINLKPNKNNYLAPMKSSKKGNRKKWYYRPVYLSIISLAGLLLIILLIGLVSYYQPAKATYEHAQSGKDQFYSAQDNISKENYLLAAENLKQAYQEFSLALDELEKMSLLRSIPYVKTQILALNNLLMAGAQTASALEKIVYLADEIITPVKTDSEFKLSSLSPDQKHEILRKISESYPDLVGVKAEIDLAVLYIEQIPEKGLMSKIKEYIDPIKKQLPDIKKVLTQALPVAELLPSIVGYPEEQTYLFLLENNAEMRPSGGFIGTYGILKVKDGEIVSFKTDNIYNLDNPVKDVLIEVPPVPLQKYLKSEKWFMRDSNWSPDFPTSAEKALWFYAQENGPEKNMNGVIAVTPNIIESLLKLTGEIKIDGITFNSENFTEQLQYQVEQGYYRQGISDADRKEVIGEMADELLTRLENFPQSRWGELWTTINNHIEEKQILFYSKNESLQTVIEEENWGGKMDTTNQGDYLYVVDANMASLKSDPGVFRTISYSINETTDGITADLNIKYENKGTFDWKSTRYRTYTRVYVPLGSQLIENSGLMTNDKLQGGKPTDPEVYEEDGKTVFAGFIAIEPQETGIIHYKYYLPNTIFSSQETKIYQLEIQKQPGTKPHQLEISLKFNNAIFRAEPIDKIKRNDNNSIILNTDLRTDHLVEVIFK